MHADHSSAGVSGSSSSEEGSDDDDDHDVPATHIEALLGGTVRRPGLVSTRTQSHFWVGNGPKLKVGLCLRKIRILF